MSERVVIASIDMDDAPVAAASQRTRGHFSGLEGSAQKLTDRMFNLRTASMAFLGSFTLAGAVFGLKQFIENVFKAASGFKEFETASTRATASFTAMVGELINANVVLADATIFFNALTRASESMRASAAGTSTSGAVWRFMFGAIPATQLLETLHLTANILKHAGLGTAPAPLTFESGAVAGAGVGKLGELNVPAKEGAAEKRKKAEDAAAMARLQDWIGQNTHGYFLWAAGVRDVNENLSKTTDLIEEIIIHDYAFVSVLDLSMERMQLWQTMLADGMSLIGSAIAEGGLTGRRALGLLLQSMSQIAFSFAAMHAAAALGATTWLGAAITGGTSQQHATAAGQWFAAGVGAAALASHFGGGGGNRSSFGGEGSGATGASSQKNITIIFEGNVASDEFMRAAVIDIKKALADGAGGGSF